MTTKTLAFNKKRKGGDNFFAEEEPMDLPEAEETKNENIDDEMEVKEVREDFPIHNKWEDEEEII